MRLFDLKTLINVFEANNTRFDHVSWSQHGGVFVTPSLSIDGKEYRLKIEPLTLDGKIVYLNIGFSSIVDGAETESLLGTGDNISKPMGAISNALRDKIKELTDEYEIKALVFFVRQGEEKRISLYKRFISSNQYGLYPWQFSGTVNGKFGNSLFATERSLQKEELNDLREFLSTLDKTLS